MTTATRDPIRRQDGLRRRAPARRGRPSVCRSGRRTRASWRCSRIAAHCVWPGLPPLLWPSPPPTSSCRGGAAREWPRTSEIAANAIAIDSAVFIRHLWRMNERSSASSVTSTVLRTRRHDSTAGQRDECGSGPTGTCPCARLTSIVSIFPMLPSKSALPMSRILNHDGDGPSACQLSGRAGGSLHIERQVRVRIPPVDLRQRAVQGDAIVEVEQARSCCDGPGR